jgi:hypothetical protein
MPDDRRPGAEHAPGDVPAPPLRLGHENNPGDKDRDNARDNCAAPGRPALELWAGGTLTLAQTEALIAGMWAEPDP